MPKLKVRYILVCEDFRQEARGLASLLGYYGMLPHVDMVVRDFAAGNRLTFVINLDPVDGTFNLVVKLLHPKGNHILTAQGKAPLKATLQKTPRAPTQPVLNAHIWIWLFHMLLPL